MPSGHTEKNGPLSAFALDALRLLTVRPLPRQQFNSGVARRLEREALVERTELPSPYPTRPGMATYLKITEAGRKRLDTGR